MRNLPLLIWAGNRLEAKNFIDFHNLISNEVIITQPNDRQKIMGLSNLIVIRVGTWYEDENTDNFNLRLLAQRMIIVNETY